jgi:uncharacterized membrane protein YwaF
MLLDGRMPIPRTFGAFHLISIIAVIALCALVIRKRELFNEKRIPYVLLAVGAVMTVLEIYKQLVLSYDAATDVWTYKWYAFPFQFCSTPIYITLLAFAFSRFGVRLKPIYDALCGFLATYALIAGTVVFCIPGSVFCRLTGVNIQTMVHHGLMIVLAFVLLASGKVKPSKKALIGSALVFLPLMVAAMIMNAVYGNGLEFDMFYLAPDSGFVITIIRGWFNGFPPYPIYVIGYAVLFTFGAWLVLFVTKRLKNKKPL